MKRRCGAGSASGKADVRVEEAVTCGGAKIGTDVTPRTQRKPKSPPTHQSAAFTAA